MRYIAGCGVLVLVVAASLATCGFLWIREQQAAGREAADEFHVLYNAGNYVAIYGTSDRRLQGGVTEEEMRRQLGEMRTELGKLREISDACFTVVSGSEGKLMRAEFVATFDSKKAWETFDWQFEGGQPRLLAFAVETGWEDGQADWEMSLGPAGVRPHATSCSTDGLLWWEQ